jgi:hypothetical protein
VDDVTGFAIPGRVTLQHSLTAAGLASNLGDDQTKYVVEQVRQRLKLEPPGTRQRTVDRLDKPDSRTAVQL